MASSSQKACFLQKFGQLPLLQDGDTQIPQSGAIMRHLARKHDLYGATIDENTRCDVIYDTKVDITNKIISIVQTKGDFVSPNLSVRRVT